LPLEAKGGEDHKQKSTPAAKFLRQQKCVKANLLFTHFSHILIEQARQKADSLNNLDGSESSQKVSDCMEK
jgi:hypothetical protein